MKIQNALLLKGYSTSQKKAIEAIIVKIKVFNAMTGTEEQVVHAAYLLHNVYCALEDLFMEIARTFENSIKEEPSFHRELKSECL